MLAKSQKNITDIIIGAGAAQSNTTVSALTAGQFGLADESGNIVTTGGGAGSITADKLRFVYRSSDGSLIASPFIKKVNAKYTSKAYVAPVEQVSAIGFSGSGSETIEVIDDNDYIVRVIMKGVTAQYGDKLMYKFGAYHSSSSATQMEVALGLASNLTVNFKREKLQNGEQLIKFEVLCDVAAGTNDMDNAVTVANGGEVVAVATAVTYNTGTALAVGDFLRFDAIGGGAPGPADGIYKVIKIDGLNVTLDRPVEMVSGVYGATDVQVIPAADAAAAEHVGVRCTGVDRAKFKAGVFNYEKIRFELQLQDFGSTIITSVSTASEGNGHFKEVQELEWFFKGIGSTRYAPWSSSSDFHIGCKHCNILWLCHR